MEANVKKQTPERTVLESSLCLRDDSMDVPENSRTVPVNQHNKTSIAADVGRGAHGA
jgi:hypothetical protein